MSNRLELPPISVIRDPNISIPRDLLHPHYDDPRFRKKNIGRVVFLAPDVSLDNTGTVVGADYMNSDGLILWLTFADFKDGPEGKRFAPDSANFFEAALNDLWPHLHKNTSGIVKFGREIPGVKLQAITSGIKGFSLYSFNEFAVVPRTAL